MVKKLLSVLAIAIMALNLSSCLDNNKHEMTQTLLDDVLIVSQNGDEFTQTKGRLQLKINLNTALADVTMPVPVDGETKNVVLKDVKVEYDTKIGYRFTATSADALDANGMKYGFTINNFDGYLQVGGTSDDTFQNIGIHYNINGKQIFVTRTDITYPFTSTLTSTGTTGFNCNTATYNFKIDNTKKTASIVIKKIQFVKESPTLSEITIPEVPYTCTSSGYHLEANEIIPTSANVPMESRKITNLDITIKAQESTFSGMFRCMGMLCTMNGKMTYSEE